MSNKTYEDFANAFYQLKKDNNDVSYGKISLSIGILESTINALANRKRANPPSDANSGLSGHLFRIYPDSSSSNMRTPCGC